MSEESERMKQLKRGAELFKKLSLDEKTQTFKKTIKNIIKDEGDS